MQTLNDSTMQCAKPATCASRLTRCTRPSASHGLQLNNIHSSRYQPGLKLNAIGRCDVAICGGGLGGLALAVGLRRKGYDAHVFEAAPELRTGTSTMIGLKENAWTALAGLHPDFVPKLKSQGQLLARMSFTLKQDKDAASESHEYSTSGTYTMRWAMVQNVLASFLPPEAVHCNHRASGCKEDADRGLVQVTFKDQPTTQARLLVAADGVRSALRQAMIPNDPGPRYLGQMIWNAVIPSNTITDGAPPSSMLLWKDQMPRVPWAVYAGLVDAGAGYTYWMTSIDAAESPSFTNGSGPGQGIPGIKARVEGILRGAGFDHVLKVVQNTPEAAIYERALFDRIPLDELGATLISPGGQVALLGDAAHAMHPEPAQGARMAFEDAETLVKCLDQHRKDLTGWASADAPAGRSMDDHRGLQAALAGYNAARLSRVCRIQRYAAETLVYLPYALSCP